MAKVSSCFCFIALIFAEKVRCQFGNFFQQPNYQQQNFHRPNQNTGEFYYPQNTGFQYPQGNFGYPSYNNYYPQYQQNNHHQNQNPYYQNSNHQYGHQNQYPNQNNYNNFAQNPTTTSTTQQTTRKTTINPPVITQKITQPTTTTTAAPLIRVDERISQSKCIEYSKLIKRKVQVASLSLSASAQDVSLTQCDAVTGLVVGGVNANANEFPHQVAIGYPDLNDDLSFKCGGSLISDQFVLTAAHCARADRTEPTVVRLGDLNLKKKETGLPELDIPIEKFLKHEAYNKDTRENDIALVKMSRPTTFSQSIRPACLQLTENIKKSKAVATGWGYTEVGGSTSDILQKVQLDIISNQQCKDLYNDEDNYNIFSSQLCAGVLKGGKDTCGGDSGGPIQITIGNECIFSIIGVTSYGSTFCGSKNSPGIYTRVSSYIDWIENNVWGPNHI